MNERIAQHVAELTTNAFTIVRQAIKFANVELWRDCADKFYAQIDECSVTRPPTDYLPQVASAALPFVETTVGLTIDRVLGAFARSLVLPIVVETFSGPIACNVNQGWLRRQYAPMNRPNGCFAHQWHQDGALRRTTETEPLTMATCWCPLVDCGSLAPGIELVARRWDRLLEIGDLDDRALRNAISPSKFQSPEMQAGDVLILLGDALHRTHATPTMTMGRTSIELRLFPQNAIPQRLAGDRFLPLSYK